jgi:hypothetical protein
MYVLAVPNVIRASSYVRRVGLIFRIVLENGDFAGVYQTRTMNRYRRETCRAVRETVWGRVAGARGTGSASTSCAGTPCQRGWYRRVPVECSTDVLYGHNYVYGRGCVTQL